MPSRARFSILLPVFNGERWLQESLDSILGQSCADWELIAWDDGSTDSSPSILAAVRDPRVRVFRNRANQGLFATLNAALREARREIVRLWTQDDRMKPHCLAREAEFWDGHPDVAMVYCQFDLIDSSGSVVRRAGDDRTPEVIEPWLADQISAYFGSMPGNISPVGIRRSVLGEVGPFAPMRVAGDFEMWVRIAARHRIGFLREPLIELRSHPGQFSRRTGEGLWFIRENRVVVQELWRRLPPPIVAHAMRYHRRDRVVQYVHYGVRVALGGDLALARAVLGELRREPGWKSAVLWWLLTANRRWMRPRPLYLPPGADRPVPPGRGG